VKTTNSDSIASDGSITKWNTLSHPHLSGTHLDAHVEHLAVGLGVGVVASDVLVIAVEARLGHVLQAVVGWTTLRQHNSQRYDRRCG
jgi:hypothetical protein